MCNRLCATIATVESLDFFRYWKIPKSSLFINYGKVKEIIGR